MTQRFSFWEDLSIEENLDFVARMYGVKNRRDAVRRSIDATRPGRAQDSTRRSAFGRLETAPRARRLPHSSAEAAACSTSRPRASIRKRAAISGNKFISSPPQALTFLITTHYMDEAERCHRLAYISYGKLLADGTVEEVIAQVGLTTWSVTGPDLPQLAEQLRTRPRRAAGSRLRQRRCT